VKVLFINGAAVAVFWPQLPFPTSSFKDKTKETDGAHCSRKRCFNYSASHLSAYTMLLGNVKIRWF